MAFPWPFQPRLASAAELPHGADETVMQTTGTMALPDAVPSDAADATMNAAQAFQLDVNKAMHAAADTMASALTGSAEEGAAKDAASAIIDAAAKAAGDARVLASQEIPIKMAQGSKTVLASTAGVEQATMGTMPLAASDAIGSGFENADATYMRLMDKLDSASSTSATKVAENVASAVSQAVSSVDVPVGSDQLADAASVAATAVGVPPAVGRVLSAVSDIADGVDAIDAAVDAVDSVSKVASEVEPSVASWATPEGVESLNAVLGAVAFGSMVFLTIGAIAMAFISRSLDENSKRSKAEILARVNQFGGESKVEPEDAIFATNDLGIGKSATKKWPANVRGVPDHLKEDFKPGETKKSSTSQPAAGNSGEPVSSEEPADGLNRAARRKKAAEKKSTKKTKKTKKVKRR